MTSTPGSNGIRYCTIEFERFGRLCTTKLELPPEPIDPSGGQIDPSGGQVDIWKVRIGCEEQVAIKSLRADLDEHAAGDAMARFNREIDIHSSLSHPHIVPVLGRGEISGMPCYMMNWADGSLRKLIELHPAGRAWDDIKDVFLPIVDAVAFAHANRVVHRDLKPENVLMYGNSPQVSDFGLGRMVESRAPRVTQLHTTGGTYGYAAPEQYGRFRDAEMPADVYALGKMLAELTSANRSNRKLNYDYIPAGLRSIVGKCLSCNPRARFSDAGDLAAALRGVVHDLAS